MKITKELLRRYVANACTPEERLAIEQWLSKPSSDIPEITDGQWQRSDHIIWVDIKKNMGDERPRIFFFRRYSGYAAAVISAVVAIYCYFGEPAEPVYRETHAVAASEGFSKGRYIENLCRKSKTIGYDTLEGIVDVVGPDFDPTVLTKPQKPYSTGQSGTSQKYYAVFFGQTSNEVVVVSHTELQMFTHELMRRVVKIRQV